MYTVLSAPTIQAGTITTRKAIRIENATLSGGGALGTQIALAIDSLTSGGVNYSIFSSGTQSMHHEGDINLFEFTGTTGSGRYLRFESGSASPVASLQSILQSTTQGDLVFNAKYATGTTDAATKEVFRIVGGASPGTLTTGNSLISGTINYTNDFSSISFYIQPNAATNTGGNGAFVLRANIAESTDTNGGSAIQIYPDQGTGANNGGRININAYGQGAGTNANSIRFNNRSGANASAERARVASDGGFAIGTAINTTVAFLTLAASTTTRSSIHFNNGADPTTPTSGDFWYKTAGLFYYDGNIQQVAKLNGPTFVGIPSAPTATAGTNTTQIATCAHVFAERANTSTFTNKTIGDKLRVATGTNASVGSATLVAGTVTVNTTSVSAGSIIFFTRTVAGGAAGTLSYTIIAGTSFTINSSSSTDTSIIGYIIIN
ncbi:MAG TPA: hypothetical protein VIM55_05320 [Mucilaginibacter sp.]